MAPANPLISGPNQEWTLDFVSDAISNGRALRALTMVDSYTRECPAIEVDTGISSRQVTRVLERVMEERENRKQYSATTGRSSRAGIFWRGVRRRRSTWYIFSRADPCRTDMWRALTDD